MYSVVSFWEITQVSGFLCTDKERKFFTNDKWWKIKGKRTTFLLSRAQYKWLYWDDSWKSRDFQCIFDARMDECKKFFHTFASLYLYQITFWEQIVQNVFFWMLDGPFMMSNVGIICSLILLRNTFTLLYFVLLSKNIFFCVCLKYFYM